MRVFLVRHGQTEWNALKKAQGHTDIPLDPIGIEQARRAGEAFRTVNVGRILTSDLMRASQTAAQLSLAVGIDYEVTSLLRERSFGEWEGSPYGEIGHWISAEAERRGIPREAVVPPGGESYRHVYERLLAVRDDMVADGRDVAVVCHGGTCSLMLAMLLGGDADLASGFRFSNASISEVEQRPDGGFRLVRYDDCTHLVGLDVMAGAADGSIR